MVEDGAFSHKKDNVKTFKEILNLEEHSNYITGWRVTSSLNIVFFFISSVQKVLFLSLTFVPTNFSPL